MLYRVCALFTLALVVLSGCGQAEPYEELTWIENAQASAAAVPYFGVESIEEIILRSDTIARVELLSKSTSVEQAASTAWVPKLEFRFRVVEYLKGSGPKEITAFVHSIWATEAEARAALPLQSTGHDSRWDDREGRGLPLFGLGCRRPAEPACCRQIPNGLDVERKPERGRLHRGQQVEQAVASCGSVKR